MSEQLDLPRAVNMNHPDPSESKLVFSSSGSTITVERFDIFVEGPTLCLGVDGPARAVNQSVELDAEQALSVAEMLTRWARDRLRWENLVNEKKPAQP